MKVINPQLSVTVELQNLGSSPVAVAHATYVISTICAAGPQTAVGSFTCSGSSSIKELQAFSKAKCSFSARLKCAAGGTAALTMLTSAGRVVNAAPVAFKAPVAAGDDAAGADGTADACVTVSFAVDFHDMYVTRLSSWLGWVCKHDAASTAE
jgi:hypothetical protein